MTTTQRTVICLMKSAITGQPVALPEGRNMRDTMIMATDQGVMALGLTGALNCGYPVTGKLMQYYMEYYCCETVHSELQLNHIQMICDAFEENGIDYMPLKGTLLKMMYPTHELRKMSDADILIRQEQYPQIPEIMTKLGFEKTGESDHEHIWENAHLKVELHKRLIPSYNQDYYSYFGEGWDLAKVQTGHRFSMIQEDAFIYNFVHFAKHYRDGEGNCRFVVDLWVHLRNCPDMDMAYIRSRMEQMKMVRFYDCITAVIKAWFEDGSWDERTERITDVLFIRDMQQRERNHSVAQDARNALPVSKSRRKRFLQKVFPDRQHMDWSYPQWKNVPLVIAWVLRWFRLLFSKKTGNKRLNGERITDQEVENYRKDLEYVGLEFSNGVALPD